MRTIKHVRGPNPARDDPLINPRCRDDQDLPSNIASNKPGKGPAFSKSPPTKPASNSLEHVSDAAHVRPLLSA